jgi:transcriptional regulator with XRE-family HTH domain
VGNVQLKRARERRGLTLAQVSERSGLDTGMLSRLENGKLTNPTLHTLWRYARAVGSRIKIEVLVGAVESEDARV